MLLPSLPEHQAVSQADKYFTVRFDVCLCLLPGFKMCHSGVGFAESTKGQQRTALGYGHMARPPPCKLPQNDPTYVNEQFCSPSLLFNKSTLLPHVWSPLLCISAPSAPQSLLSYPVTVLEAAGTPLRWQQQHVAAQAVQCCSLQIACQPHCSWPHPASETRES